MFWEKRLRLILGILRSILLKLKVNVMANQHIFTKQCNTHLRIIVIFQQNCTVQFTVILLITLFLSLVASATLGLFSIFFLTIHSFIHPFAEGPLLFLIALRSVEGLPGVPSRDLKLGPAVQQADALLSELRRTLSELRRTLLAAPHPKSCATPSELRRTL